MTFVIIYDIFVIYIVTSMNVISYITIVGYDVVIVSMAVGSDAIF